MLKNLAKLLSNPLLLPQAFSHTPSAFPIPPQTTWYPLTQKMDRFNTRKRKAQAEQYEEEKPTKKLKQTGLSFANSSTSSSNNRSSVTNPQNCIRIVSWNVNGIRATVNK